MTRKETILHLLETISYIESLEDVPEDIWRTPIGEQKWSLAELVGHFTPWDRFVTEQRIPFILKGELLPKSPKAEEVNAASSLKSRNKPSEQIIHEFAATRSLQIRAIRTLEDSYWEQTISIGTNVINLSNYFKGLAEHDIHHFQEIEEFLKQFNIHKPLNL
ncbi:DinB family protein [Chungangia koreensis]|uniref:DinB family protein n=1 Tax=Chungangia koreensis TaxID=752657 RepID=A0ABV8X6H6_9LACT